MALFSGVVVKAQEKRFDFGFNLYPNYSIGILSSNGSIPAGFESSFRELETWKPSVSASIFVEYKLNERSILGFGIGYQNNGVRTVKQELFPQYDPSMGDPIIDPSLPSQVRFVYNHHNIEVPLYYRHVFGTRFFLLAGISGIINVSNTSTSVAYFSEGNEIRNKQFDNSTAFRRLNFSGNLGFGLDYLKTDRISLYVLPFAQYAFLGVSKTAALNRNHLSIGLSTGIRL